MNKKAYATPEYRRIRNLARSFYKDDGANGWAHIQEVRRRAAKMVRRLEGRSLTPAEYAAVLMHDSTKGDKGGQNHGRLGALRASHVLATALSSEQLAEAAEAIAVHDDNLPKFPSRTAELLASADANPPDLDWVLNKSYVWGKNKGLSNQEAADRLADPESKLKKFYGTGGAFNWPGIYKEYYGDRVPQFQKAVAGLDLDTVHKKLDAYHSKYSIDPDKPRVIHNM